jgi:hypothetical protein
MAIYRNVFNYGYGKNEKLRATALILAVECTIIYLTNAIFNV